MDAAYAGKVDDASMITMMRNTDCMDWTPDWMERILGPVCKRIVGQTGRVVSPCFGARRAAARSGVVSKARAAYSPQSDENPGPIYPYH
jgi:hypothetical protein